MDDNDWTAAIGRTRARHSAICFSQAQRLAATLNQQAPNNGVPLPPLWHWAFFQDMTPTQSLSGDGHAPRGDFLPAVNLPNRMWAGSRIDFFNPIMIGDTATCTSTIDDVVVKHGRSGTLVFVTVRHEYKAGGTLAIREEQDIVYRNHSAGRSKKTSDHQPPDSHWRQSITPSPILLFRYSAVTFNSHRIHYDTPYVTDSEGYPGLLVHGPLIATLMCGSFSRNNDSARLRRFAFRGHRPLICPQPFDVAGVIREPGIADVWAADRDGIASSGEIEFE